MEEYLEGRKEEKHVILPSTKQQPQDLAMTKLTVHKFELVDEKLLGRVRGFRDL